ncbi:nucleotidyl transferase AbiEii/AbiGii toxin family protein [Candidatus Woesearchaeota archaeon]|nr:nucleotidyl transferase AbiEii/AbiGii toxin family protein [Candidatus Woesearchaeota archaeon]
MIPLSLRMKRESHRAIAAAQDVILKEVYQHFDKAVLHGGTAIWRCYQGKRFSEDLDFCFPKDPPKIQALFASLEKQGFRVRKRKIGERSVYSELEMNRVAVRLEATFQKLSGHLTDYETADGNFVTVYSLTPEAFIAEKARAYLQRRKVRDLYDIFFLLKRVTRFPEVKKELQSFLKSYAPPVDELDLKALILEGPAPSAREMLDSIQRTWENANISTA